MAGRFSDFIITRFFTNTFSRVSVRFSPLHELGTPGVNFLCPTIPLRWLLCGHLVLQEDGREVRLQEGCALKKGCQSQ